MAQPPRPPTPVRPNPTAARKAIELETASAGSPDEEVPLVSFHDHINIHQQPSAPSNALPLRELQKVELGTHPRQRSRISAPMQVVDWKKEKESFNLLLKTDQGLWFLAKVASFLLGIRLVIQALGASNDTALSTFILVMTQPLVRPFLTITQNIPLGGERILETPAALAMACVFVSLGFLAKLLGALGGSK